MVYAAVMYVPENIIFAVPLLCVGKFPLNLTQVVPLIFPCPPLKPAASCQEKSTTES